MRNIVNENIARGIAIDYIHTANGEVSSVEVAQDPDHPDCYAVRAHGTLHDPQVGGSELFEADLYICTTSEDIDDEVNYANNWPPFGTAFKV